LEMARYYKSKRKASAKKYGAGISPGRCALYIVRDRRSSDVKIGISNDPERRLSQIQSTYNVGSVELLEITWFLTRAEALALEATFHQRYATKNSPARGGREWFTLTDVEIHWFIDWMKRSTTKRAFKATRVSTTVYKTAEELTVERRSAFWGATFVSFFTVIVPVVAYSVTKQPVLALAAPAGIGAIASSRVKREKVISRVYDDKGRVIPAELPVHELRLMGLWEEAHKELPAHTIKPGQTLPESFNF
jgi:predicted GIY-YIG superfamily endonuclease